MEKIIPNIVVIIMFIVLYFFYVGAIPVIVYLIFRKNKYAKYAYCFNWWLTLSFLLPRKMKKYGMKKKFGVILMLLSPMALITYFGIYEIQQHCFPFPLSYEKIRYKTSDEIKNITAIEDFPAFTYSHNKQEPSFFFDNDHFSNVYFTFEKGLSPLVERKIIAWCNDEDNILWEKDKTDDVKFFGDSCVYKLYRAWDEKYIKSPIKWQSREAGVTITIGKKGFMISYGNDEYNIPNLEKYVEKDSLLKNTGVNFPNYKVVYFSREWEDVYPDDIDTWDNYYLLLEQKPSERFIRKLKNNPKWRKLKDYGWYECQYMDGVDNISVIVDPERRVVTIRRAIIGH